MSNHERRDGEFTATEMTRLLDLVSTKLAARGVPALVYVVGGAAIALRHDGRRTTDDIDGLAVPPGEVLAAAREVAHDEGLREDWLSTAAQPWIPTPHKKVEPGATPGLTVELAPPEHLLAMKLIARRGARDMNDILILARALGVSRAEDLREIVVAAYGEDMIESVHGGLDNLLLDCRVVERRLTE